LPESKTASFIAGGHKIQPPVTIRGHEVTGWELIVGCLASWPRLPQASMLRHEECPVQISKLDGQELRFHRLPGDRHLGRGGDYLLALPVYRAVQWIGVRIGDEVRQGYCVNLSDLRCSRLDPERDGHDHTPVARFPPAVLDRLSQSAARFFYRYSLIAAILSVPPPTA
jgi:hypothetical protein